MDYCRGHISDYTNCDAVFRIDFRVNESGCDDRGEGRAAGHGRSVGGARGDVEGAALGPYESIAEPAPIRQFDELSTTTAPEWRDDVRDVLDPERQWTLYRGRR